MKPFHVAALPVPVIVVYYLMVLLLLCLVVLPDAERGLKFGFRLKVPAVVLLWTEHDECPFHLPALVEAEALIQI